MAASSLLLQRLWEVGRAVGAGEGEVVRGTAFSVNFDIDNINIRSAAPSTSTMQPTTASSLNCSWWMHAIYREHSEMQWSRTPTNCKWHSSIPRPRLILPDDAIYTSAVSDKLPLLTLKKIICLLTNTQFQTFHRSDSHDQSPRSRRLRGF
jgi:hypothetical protein